VTEDPRSLTAIFFMLYFIHVRYI